MSKTSDDLRDLLDIFNPYDASTFAAQRGGIGVFLSYRASEGGRVSRSAAWQVVRPGYQTDPDAHWQDYGNKTFSVSRYTRPKAERMAREWAIERYGVEEWVKVTGLPWALYPASDAKIITDALREARKAARVAAQEDLARMGTVEERPYVGDSSLIVVKCVHGDYENVFKGATLRHGEKALADHHETKHPKGD